jgi:tRNA (guanine-N7-)-methyltransferase
VGRALKHDIPGADWRISEEDVREKGWEAIFGSELPQPLRFVIEIGFGNGDFLIDRARRDPRAALVGVEYSRKRVLKTARKLARTGIANVRLLLSTGEVLIAELLPEASVYACWVNFPDPWPKKRHHRRRLVKPGFVRQVALRLSHGGSLYVATDHVDYAEVIDAVLAEETLLENAYAPAPFLREVPDRMPTRYEREWRAEGRPLHFWRYRRKASA